MKNIIYKALFLLLVVSCSKGESVPNDHGVKSALENKKFFDQIGDVKPFRAAPYSEKMQKCVYANTSEKSCLISELPVIGLSRNAITIDDILDRTLVSHQFLGETFKEVLLRIHPEVLQLFGAVSAVIISDKINPSFYYSNTGAIYLSGRYFWRNEKERKAMTQVRDSREGAGLPLQYTFTSQYIKDGNLLKSRAQKNIQTYDEMINNTLPLLFHELTHANDYFPSSFYNNAMMNPNKTYQKTAYERYKNFQLQSDNMPSQISSELLRRMGQILYQGKEVTKEDTEVLAEKIIQDFKQDVANDDYAYSSTREDYAMIAEEALTLYYLEAPRYIFVFKFPSAYFVPPKDYVYQVAWGEKSRVLEPKIKERATYAVVSDFGSEVGQKIINKLNDYQFTEIPANSSWDEILAL